MAFTQYLGLDVLEIPPNTTGAEKDGYSRSVAHLDPGFGKVTADGRSYGPVPAYEFAWFMDGRSDVDTFKQFIANRKGQAVPFWVPSWCPDLVLAADAAAIDTSIIVQAVDYTSRLFTKNARRYLAIVLDNGTLIYRHVTLAVNNGNGTETLTLDSAVGSAAPASTTMVSFLRYSRLGEDEITTKWESTTMAQAVLKIVEIPAEAP